MAVVSVLANFIIMYNIPPSPRIELTPPTDLDTAPPFTFIIGAFGIVFMAFQGGRKFVDMIIASEKNLSKTNRRMELLFGGSQKSSARSLP